jgi:hypothetical protein
LQHTSSAARRRGVGRPRCVLCDAGVLGAAARPATCPGCLRSSTKDPPQNGNTPEPL